MRIDKSGKLRFASLQGETAARLLGDAAGRFVHPLDSDTVVYLRGNEEFERSTAVLEILADIGGGWRWTKIFFLVPKPIRDFVYRLVAKNRYRIMNKRESCRVPTEAESRRLLL